MVLPTCFLGGFLPPSCGATFLPSVDLSLRRFLHLPCTRRFLLLWSTCCLLGALSASPLSTIDLPWLQSFWWSFEHSLTFLLLADNFGLVGLPCARLVDLPSHSLFLAAVEAWRDLSLPTIGFSFDLYRPSWLPLHLHLHQPP